MKIIHHRGRPVIDSSEERWRPSLRLAFNRAVPGHRVMEKGETFERPEAKRGLITN
ncbi:MAG TPA: hypothetical protein VGA09_14650 [Candidatus Binatia bacterium]